MDIRQLKYFLAVAEEGLITKAAEKLHMTQPPLSQQIINLEKELGITLFQRQKKYLTLTPAGKILVTRAKQMLNLMQLTVNDLQEMKSTQQGKITIGLINSSGRLILPQIIQLFLQKYPLFTFDLKQGDSNYILKLLDDDIVDIGFVRPPVDVSLYNQLPISIEKITLISNSDKFHLIKPAMCLDEISDKPLLIHRRYETTILTYFQQKKLKPHIFCISDEIIPLLTWAICGLGIAIVPEFSTKLFAHSNLTITKLIEPQLTVASTLIWKKQEILPSNISYFIKLFTNYTKS